MNFCECVGLVGGCDVDPEVVGREGLARLLFILEVDGFLSDDANDRAVFALDDDAQAREDVGVDAANLVEIEESAVVNVADHEANLVGMSHEHDLGAVFAFAVGDTVAVGVGRDLVDIGTDGIGEESRNALLAA